MTPKPSWGLPEVSKVGRSPQHGCYRYLNSGSSDTYAPVQVSQYGLLLGGVLVAVQLSQTLLPIDSAAVREEAAAALRGAAASHLGHEMALLALTTAFLWLTLHKTQPRSVQSSRFMPFLYEGWKSSCRDKRSPC